MAATLQSQLRSNIYGNNSRRGNHEHWIEKRDDVFVEKTTGEDSFVSIYGVHVVLIAVDGVDRYKRSETLDAICACRDDNVHCYL